MGRSAKISRIFNWWGWQLWLFNTTIISSAAAEQALQNSDLQIYEIPLDSVIQQSSRNSIYSNIGGKRVAPRRESGDSVKQKTSRKDLEKQVKKRDSKWKNNYGNDRNLIFYS